MSKKLYGIMVIVIFIGLLLCLFFYKSINNKSINYDNRNEIKEEIIIYYSGNNKYEFIRDDNSIKVNKYDVIECIKAPCDPIKTDSYVFKYDSNLINTLLFNSLLNGKNNITISDKDLSDFQIKCINSLINNDDSYLKKDKVEYKISNNVYKSISSSYSVLKDNGETELVIYMGERNTGGYSINVQSVTFDEQNNVKVIVSEHSPKPSDIVTMAFTYPSVSIKFDITPNSFLVYNTDGKEYKEIKEDL